MLYTTPIMASFIHLHTHSHYSLLNALPQIKELVEAAQNDSMPALALTDSGNMYGAIDFYKSCVEAGIKPIIGVDAYLASRTRFDKQSGVDSKRYRLVLLAKNKKGYQDLIKLVTASYLEGFYYKPRIDLDLLRSYTDDLVCISPSFSGDVATFLKEDKEAEARERLSWYKDAFGKENVFIEITHHPEIPNHSERMDALKSFAKDTNTPLVAAHDVYYMKPEDRTTREALMAIQTNRVIGDTDMGEGEDFSFINQKKAKEYFKDTPEALENTI